MFGSGSGSFATTGGSSFAFLFASIKAAAFSRASLYAAGSSHTLVAPSLQ